LGEGQGGIARKLEKPDRETQNSLGDYVEKIEI
jgi:hypothetical protein